VPAIVVTGGMLLPPPQDTSSSTAHVRLRSGTSRLRLLMKKARHATSAAVHSLNDEYSGPGSLGIEGKRDEDVVGAVVVTMIWTRCGPELSNAAEVLEGEQVAFAGAPEQSS